MSALGLRLEKGFRRHFGTAPAACVRAPGRVNLIGEHTDYNDGFVLPAAISGETRVAFRRRDDRNVRVVALDFGEQHDLFSLDAPIRRADAGGWRDYVRGTFHAAATAGIPLAGLDLMIAGDLPRGIGLSSSASLEVAVAGAAVLAAGTPRDPTALALIGQAAENDFVGMRCGIMDQLASAACREGAALLIDCRSLATQAVPIPDDVAIMIVQSGVERGLVEGHYNQRRRQCEDAAAALGVPALRDADLAGLETAGDRLADPARRRARHVVTENARTLAAAEALRKGDLAELGRLMRASHASMRDDFEITVPAIDRLAALLDDAIGGEGGARMTGGGFGGAVVALLRQAEVARVSEHVAGLYRTPGGAAPRIMIERPQPGFGPVQDD